MKIPLGGGLCASIDILGRDQDMDLPRFSRVLVVDDSRMMRKLLQHLLEGAGYSVAFAEQGTEALETLVREPFDFVLTDRNMPGMDGMELCRRIRGMTLPHYVYIALMTSEDAAADIVMALDAGADDFLSKPIMAPVMLAQLRTAERFLALERKLRLLSRQDPLTQVLNRRTFQELVEREWSLSQRYLTPLSCVMLDIDHFKTINDRFGHPAGDEVLRQFSELLQMSCRRPDYVCRYGGEEFCILLPNTDLAGAQVCAQRCLEAIRRARFHFGIEEVLITASLGIAERVQGQSSAELMINSADQALLIAKRRGRNQIVEASDAARETSLNEAAIWGPDTITGGPQTAVLLDLLQNDQLRNASEFSWK